VFKLFISFIGFIVALGTPASHYTDCNNYGNGLGDIVGNFVKQLFE
jgi:hypothetical protein